MKERVRMTWKSVEEFGRYLHNEEKSSHTIEQYLRDVTALYEFLGGGSPVLRKEELIRYKLALREKYASANTVNAKLSAINCYLDFMDLHSCRVKALKVQRKMFRDPARELNRDEYGRLLEAARKKRDQRLFLLLQTICSSGIRVSEVQFVTVEGVRGNCAEVTAKGKTRRIFLPEKLRKKLLHYANSHDITSGPIFITRNRRPMDRSNIWRAMKELCALAGVEPSKVFPHNLRHLFARCFYQLKHDLVHLADILGHTSVETTRVYTLSSGREHEAAIAALGLTG